LVCGSFGPLLGTLHSPHGCYSSHEGYGWLGARCGAAVVISARNRVGARFGLLFALLLSIIVAVINVWLI
jgi:hypothetical protein